MKTEYDSKKIEACKINLKNILGINEFGKIFRDNIDFDDHSIMSLSMNNLSAISRKKFCFSDVLEISPPQTNIPPTPSFETSINPPPKPKIAKQTPEKLFTPKTPQNLYNKPNMRNFKSKLKNLRDLCYLLTKIFLGQKINFFEMELDVVELQILKFVIEKKFKQDLSDDLDLSNKDDIFKLKEKLFITIDNLNNFISNKRSEENNKFVYKLVMKKLKHKFYNWFVIKNSPKGEQLFYEHYFKQQCNETGLKLEDYKDPLNRKNQKKTLNNEFFARIFKSKLFKDDFFRYLKRNFKNHY